MDSGNASAAKRAPGPARIPGAAPTTEEELLRRQLRSLTRRSVQLSHRLMRVEQSVLFRFLRWLGGRLLKSPPWLQRLLPFARMLASGAPMTYSQWVEEDKLMDAIEKLGAREPSNTPLPLVSFTVVTDRDEGKDTQAVAQSQTYPSLEVLCCTPSALGRLAGRCRGEFIALVSRDTVLEPGAVDAWVAATDEAVNLVYSDSDQIDSGGRRHMPCFTPEYSPELLSGVLYSGDCFLVRASAIAGFDGLSLHDLALHTARQPGRTVRVPRVLWHRQSPASPRLAAHRPSAARKETASLVICSRSPDLLRRCLAALKPTLSTSDEVIVVAHEGRPGGPVSQVAADFGARAISYQGAFHFGFMNGEGARVAGGDVIVFMNDDVLPRAQDWLDRMATQAARPDVGAVGALLLYPSGKIQHAGVVVGGHMGPTHIGRFLRDSALWPWLRMTREVTAVTGACMAIRRTVWDELGGFNPRFPVNYNDTDLCLRARKRGYRVVLEAGAVLTHEESQSRNPALRPEEFALFTDLWSEVLEVADPYFHPALLLAEHEIQLHSPWSRLR